MKESNRIEYYMLTIHERINIKETSHNYVRRRKIQCGDEGITIIYENHFQSLLKENQVYTPFFSRIYQNLPRCLNKERQKFYEEVKKRKYNILFRLQCDLCKVELEEIIEMEQDFPL